MGLETASVLTEGRTPSQLRDSGGLGDSLTALSSFCQPLRRWIRHTHLQLFYRPLPTANAIAPEQDGKTFQDRVKDAVVEKVMEGD